MDKTGQNGTGYEKEILKQYKSLCQEAGREEIRIREMSDEIDKMSAEYKEVTDVVTMGKKGKKPLGTCVIRGHNDYTKIHRKKARLRERKAIQEIKLAKIENMILDVEEFINNVEDSELRMILRLYFIEAKTWAEVAENMGSGYTQEGCKKKIQRFFNRK